MRSTWENREVRLSDWKAKIRTSVASRAMVVTGWNTCR